ncbi:Hypothetical_protein [Hexamita inflata]|uniref:Hypothetical_protein n=1 Tax=Hexamita inflata TaxID=28002 RepID=A0AA86TJZ8_9EUKA|nr:Hypothetical protein HINF_LOCUS2943 [Hexamita inflata]
MATLDKSCGCSMRQQALFHNLQNKSKMNRDMEVKTLSNIVTYSDIQQLQMVSLDLISMLKQSKSATLLKYNLTKLTYLSDSIVITHLELLVQLVTKLTQLIFTNVHLLDSTQIMYQTDTSAQNYK